MLGNGESVIDKRLNVKQLVDGPPNVRNLEDEV
jgi:hypothetical protein